MSAASNTSAETPPDSAGSSQTFAGYDLNEAIVYWLDIALFGVIAVFLLAALPRTIGRLSNFAELTRGLILRTGSSNIPPPSRRTTGITPVHHSNSNDTVESDLSPTLANHTRYPVRAKEYFDPSGSAPLHVPSLSTVLYPISTLSSYSVTHGKTLGKVVLSLIYITGILFVVFYSADPLADSARLGDIAVSQIPFVIALGTKNNIIGMLLSKGYERLNFFHRLVGLVTVAVANFHALGFLYKYAIAGNITTMLRLPFIIWGIFALLGIELLFVFSLNFFRQRFYPLFLAMHILGLFLFMFCVAMHQQEAVPYVVLGVAIYGFDHLLRAVRTRISTARIRSLPDLGMTRVEIRGLRTGWRAGQHVRVRFLTMELGFSGWTFAHPFTIANASDSEENRGLVLMCKKAGRWTNKLYNAADRCDYYGTEDGLGHYREIKVIVEGPYGGLGNMVLSSYSAVMIITGGSGVTFALSEAEEVVQMLQRGRSRIRFIEVVWITQDMNSLNALVQSFSSIISACNTVPNVLLKISVRYSRASPSPEEKDTGATNSIASLPPSLELRPGRPKLKKMLDSTIRCTSSLDAPSGVAVCVCGPIELVAEVRDMVRDVDGPKRSSVGGVELHEEVFGW